MTSPTTRPDVSPQEIDFHSPEFLNNPYPYYDIMRREAPILRREDWELTFFSTYEDVNTLLRDRRFGRAILHVATREELGWDPVPEEYAPFYRRGAHSMMSKEPPDHTRLKGLVQRAFTPRTVEKLRPRVQAIARRLLDEAAARGTLDLIADYAAPLSVTVIAELLGVPEPDRPKLRPWSRDIVAMFEVGGHSHEVAMRAVAAQEEFSAYLADLLDQRRDDPQDDLISALAAVEDGGERLSEDELIATSILILNAGHEATVNVVGNGMTTLLLQPGELARLRADHTLIESAIEEMLRYDTPLPIFRRWVLEDVEYKGAALKRGEEIALLLGSANHDPAQFPDPETFDISRSPNPHISFGAGIHYCLGAPLARLELQVGVLALLDRFRELTLLNDDLDYGDSFVFRGLGSVPVKVEE